LLRLAMPVLGVADMARAVRFWTEALGYEVKEGGSGARWTELGPPGHTRSELALQHSDEPAQEHPRVHVDLYADDKADQDRQIRRLLELGASEVGWDMYPDDPDFVVLADPEDNRFCVVDASYG
jgi:catechol 2,3-dioxygenase-like lactoylglutathione lyase family enzyme